MYQINIRYIFVWTHNWSLHIVNLLPFFSIPNIYYNNICIDYNDVDP